MNILPLFYLICKFCADSQNQEPSVDWGGSRTEHVRLQLGLTMADEEEWEVWIACHLARML